MNFILKMFVGLPLLLLLISCQLNGSRYGSVTNQNGERFNFYHFQAQIGLKEDKVLADLVNIKNSKSVALVADYRDDYNSISYVTVFARPGQDLEVRKLVLSLGWMSVKDIPKGLKEISRVLAN